jgi:UDP-N-acetylmuramyl tripeptide synthase
VEQEGVEAFGFEGRGHRGLPAAEGGHRPVAAAYYEHPTRNLEVLAVTGTNGKTSTAWWLAQALSNLPEGRWPCAVIGTLGSGRPPHVDFNGLTTPDPVLLQAAFRRFVDEGLKACAIEASSIGLAERRLDGTRIGVAVFTNFTQDHLDYHGSMEAYWDAKAELFRWPGLRAAVVNIDDAQGVALMTALQDSGLDLWPVSCEHQARLQARHRLRRCRPALHRRRRRRAPRAGHRRRRPVQRRQPAGRRRRDARPGRAAGRCRACLRRAAAGARPHGAAAAGRASRWWRSTTRTRPTRWTRRCRPASAGHAARRPLWCVFGCGGDRDPTKRPLMAAVAEKNADRVVVTSDNPRSEKPEDHHQPDPAGPVARASRRGAGRPRPRHRGDGGRRRRRDVILLAGKGHEDYQEIAGVKHAFDDRDHARRALEARA